MDETRAVTAGTRAEAPAWARPDAAPPRHISIVTETFAPEINGVALTLGHLVDGLRSEGHAVSVVRPRQRKLDRPGRSDDLALTVVGGLALPVYKGLQLGLPAGRVLRERWMRQRPDVVYVATEGPLGWSAVSTARRLGIPVFSGFHTNFHVYSKHYHAGWSRLLILRYLCALHNRTDGTIVASGDVRDRLAGLGVRDVSVVGRAVDSRRFNPKRRCGALRRAWGVSGHDLVALYVGRLAPEKNLGLAIEAYRAMQRVNGAATFVVVGDGPMRASLQRRHPDLIFCGVRTGEDLARHYASADVFLFPSETETFGNVTLEAMASGLAVVAYDYAAAHLHIESGKTGVLVPFGDRRAFVDAAVDVAGTAARAVEQAGAVQSLAEMRRRARDYAASLSWQGVVRRFAALLLGAPKERT